MRNPDDFEVCSVLARKGVKASRQRSTKAPSYIGGSCQFLLLASAQQNIWCNGSQSWLLISIIWELLKVLLPRPRYLSSDLMLTCSPYKTHVTLLPRDTMYVISLMGLLSHLGCQSPIKGGPDLKTFLLPLVLLLLCAECKHDSTDRGKLERLQSKLKRVLGKYDK